MEAGQGHPPTAPMHAPVPARMAAGFPNDSIVCTMNLQASSSTSGLPTAHCPHLEANRCCCLSPSFLRLASRLLYFSKSMLRFPGLETGMG